MMTRKNKCQCCGINFARGSNSQKYCSVKCRTICINARRLARYRRNPQKFRTVARKSYRKHRKSQLARHRVYYQKNRDRIIENVRKWTRRNKQKALQRARDWYQSHKDDPVFKAKRYARYKAAQERSRESSRKYYWKDPLSARARSRRHAKVSYWRHRIKRLQEMRRWKKRVRYSKIDYQINRVLSGIAALELQIKQSQNEKAEDHGPTRHRKASR